MEVQEKVITAAYQFQAWIDTLSPEHFIAMAVCYFFGYWLRGHRHV